MSARLAALRPLVEIIAAERTTSRPELFDDAVQEGLIAAWQALEARPDAPAAYVTGAARNGVRSALRGRITGGGHQGRQDAADFADGFAPDYEHPSCPAAAKALELAELVPHLPVIRAAVAALEPRDVELVVLRFVHGLDWPAVGARLGRSGNAVRVRFRDHLTPKLRSELAHLAGAA